MNLLKQRSDGMKINSTAPTHHLISLPGYTKGRKKPYFRFHIIKVSPLYLSLLKGNQPTATLSRHHTAFMYERLGVTSRGQAAEPQGWGEKA